MITRFILLALCALAVSCMSSCVATGDFSIHDPATGLTVSIGKNPIGSK